MMLTGLPSELQEGWVVFLALAYLISRCSLAQFIASMVSYSLHFDPGAFGTPEDWNSRAAYATWNRRQAQHYEPGSFPVSPSERLADFYTSFGLQE